MANPKIRVLFRRGTFFAILTIAVATAAAVEVFDVFLLPVHPMIRLLRLPQLTRSQDISVPHIVRCRHSMTTDTNCGGQALEPVCKDLFPSGSPGIMDPLKQDSHLNSFEKTNAGYRKLPAGATSPPW
jgi:hypothetical protein